MATEGNPNSVSDAGVGAVCALAAVEGGWLNVMINLGGMKSKEVAEALKGEANAILEGARLQKELIFKLVTEKLC